MFKIKIKHAISLMEFIYPFPIYLDLNSLWLDLTWQPVVDSIEITCDSTRLDKLVTRLDSTWHNLVTRLDSTRQSWHNLVTRLDLTCLKSGKTWDLLETRDQMTRTRLRLGSEWLVQLYAKWVNVIDYGKENSWTVLIWKKDQLS